MYRTRLTTKIFVAMIFTIGLNSFLPVLSTAQAYCSMCMGDASCLKRCAEISKPATKPAPTPRYTPPSTYRPSQSRSAPRQRPVSGKWVRGGDYCKRFVSDSKTNYNAMFMGGSKCCCQGGVDAPVMKTEGSGYSTRQVCYCPQPPASAGERCIETVANAGCKHLPDSKKKFWAGVESNYSGTIRAYCCQNTSLTPTLTQSRGLTTTNPNGEKIGLLAPPICSCFP